MGTLVDNSSSGSCRSFHCKIFLSDICWYLYLLFCSLEILWYSLWISFAGCVLAARRMNCNAVIVLQMIFVELIRFRCWGFLLICFRTCIDYICFFCFLLFLLICFRTSIDEICFCCFLMILEFNIIWYYDGEAFIDLF